MVSKITSRCMGTVQMKWEKSPKAGSESEKRCDLRREQKMERGGATVTYDGRLFHTRVAVIGNALSLTDKYVEHPELLMRQRT